MEIMQIPQICSLHVQSNIRYRYAHTVVCSEVLNTVDSAQEVTFSITVPDTAFISSFSIEVDEKIYDAKVKEKEQAKEEYTQAVQRGRTAAHIAVNSRESNCFSVSVNVETQKKVKFTLTYEELLNRKLGTYKHFINLEPGQIVDDFSVQINIEESTDITTLSVPAFNTDAEAVNTLATILRPTPHSAVVNFAPTPDQQRKLSNDGIKGQLVVLYDVDRSFFPSQILVNDGYFAHFFAPDHLKPLPKYVMFVLDISGSMSGRKIEQLKEAMESILSELRPHDYFTLLTFMSTVEIWRLVGDGEFSTASIQETDWKSLLVPATMDNIIRAKLAIHRQQAGGGTNIYTAFMTATHIAQLRLKLQQAKSVALETLIIFLTDGQPTVGQTGIDEIINETTRWNQMGRAAIFSLGLGTDVDFDFLKKLSLRNSGFARKIYEASDTALQLTNFYQEVSSPLLSSITFIYQPEQVEPTSITRNQFVTFFHGSELVVCGKVGQHVSQEDFHYSVTGNSSEGTRQFEPEKTKVQFLQKPGFMERLWGYLTIQQLLEEERKLSGKQAAEKKHQATQLALKFSFVTPVTSLVVVKPEDGNEGTDVDLGDYDMLDDCSFELSETQSKFVCHKKKKHCKIQGIEPEFYINDMRACFMKCVLGTEEEQQQEQLPIYDKIFLSDFYIQTDETNTYPCIICSKKITEDSSGNLKNHVFTSHPEEYKHSMLDFDFYHPDDSLISQQVTAAMNDTNISHFVEQKIPDKASRVKYILQSKVKQHTQCLQLHLTKKQNHFFLIISIQPILSETEGVLTLATVEIQSGSSPDTLAHVITTILCDYNINKNQILFFITDCVYDMTESSNTDENEQIEKIAATVIEGVKSIGIPGGGWNPKKLLNDSVCDALKSIQPVVSKSEEMKIRTVSDMKNWHSTYNILKNLLASKETSELSIKEEEWQEIAQITDVFKSLETLAEKQHTLGDFYGMWINYVEDIKKIGTPFAKTLSKCVHNKATTECPLFMAMLFLNPKHKSYLDDHQVSLAIEQVIKIWQSITSSWGVSGLVGNKELQQLLKGYQNSVQEAAEYTALQYWESRKDVQPILYKIASVALSAPLPKSCIDQLLSNTNIILSSLPDDIKQAITTIRCLKSFLTQITATNFTLDFVDLFVTK